MAIKLTPERALVWLKNMDEAHRLSVLLLKCSAWSLESLKTTMGFIDASSENVIQLKTKTKLTGGIKPFPTEEYTSFEALGRALDARFALISKLLPEVENEKED